MQGIVSSFSLFTDTRIWKVKKSQHIENLFAGVSTIVVVLLIWALFAMELKTVFEETKKTVVQNDLPYKDSKSTYLTTQKDKSGYMPIMLAFYATDVSKFQTSFNINPGTNSAVSYNLETCTKNHFPDEV